MRQPKFFNIYFPQIIGIGIGYNSKELIFIIGFFAISLDFEQLNKKDNDN